MAEQMFKVAKQTDPDIQKYISEIPDEYKKLITNWTPIDDIDNNTIELGIRSVINEKTKKQ